MATVNAQYRKLPCGSDDLADRRIGSRGGAGQQALLDGHQRTFEEGAPQRGRMKHQGQMGVGSAPGRASPPGRLAPHVGGLVGRTSLLLGERTNKRRRGPKEPNRWLRVLTE